MSPIQLKFVRNAEVTVYGPEAAPLRRGAAPDTGRAFHSVMRRAALNGLGVAVAATLVGGGMIDASPRAEAVDAMLRSNAGTLAATEAAIAAGGHRVCYFVRGAYAGPRDPARDRDAVPDAMLIHARACGTDDAERRLATVDQGRPSADPSARGLPEITVLDRSEALELANERNLALGAGMAHDAPPTEGEIDLDDPPGLVRSLRDAIPNALGL